VIEQEHPHANLGYRVLTDQEQQAVAALRRAGEELQALIEQLRSSAMDADPRWVSIGQTHFQEGLMALVRSVTKPDFF
jgi:hypothetical protein